MPRATSGTSASVCGSAGAGSTAGARRGARPALALALALIAALAGSDARAGDGPAANGARASAAPGASPTEGGADDAVDACATASEEGQELRDQGRLRAARDLFVACAAARCPAIVQKDCAGWMAQVDERLPTVAVHARDAAGRDVADVRVTVDGETLAERLDGRALAVDPGARTFRFTRPGAPDVVAKLLLREGEKDRLVDVVIGAPPPPARPEGRTFSVPAPAWVLGGAAFVAAGVGVGFGVAAKAAVDDMRRPGGCAPSCDPARVDGARRDMILANVLLGAGGAALVAAAVLTIVHVRSAPEPGRAAPGAPSPSPVVAWRLAAGPGALSVSGSF